MSAYGVTAGIKADLPIHLIEPLAASRKSLFGNGWAAAFVHTKSNQLIQLFQDEKFINTGEGVFEGFDRDDVSPTGIPLKDVKDNLGFGFSE